MRIVTSAGKEWSNRIFIEGYKSGIRSFEKRREPLPDNPYPKSTNEFELWEAGFDWGMTDAESAYYA
jgi:hypothetical protein